MKSIKIDRPSPVSSQRGSSESIRREWNIVGLTCASDAIRLEHGLKKVKGVLNIVVNPVNEHAYIDFDPSLSDEQTLLSELEQLGFHTS